MTLRDLPDDAGHLSDRAARVMARAVAANLAVATAESCTGGLLASLLTDLPGASSAFERGVVTYSAAAKAELLGIDAVAIARHGTVSAEIAAAMADGMLERSRADVAVAITGFAGPGPAKAGSREEAGLVHLAARPRTGRLIARECHYGDLGRDRVRLLAAGAALEMLDEAIGELLASPKPAAGKTG